MKIAVVLAALALAVVPMVAKADRMEWTVTSLYPYRVQLKFFSQTRPGVTWPGSGRALGLNDSAPHSYTLDCRHGEKICYGAWPTEGDAYGEYTKHWGAGVRNEAGCEGCCAICGDEDPDITLTR